MLGQFKGWPKGARCKEGAQEDVVEGTQHQATHVFILAVITLSQLMLISLPLAAF